MITTNRLLVDLCIQSCRRWTLCTVTKDVSSLLSDPSEQPVRPKQLKQGLENLIYLDRHADDHAPKDETDLECWLHWPPYSSNSRRRSPQP
jgi:hypothetical protein